MDSPPVNSLGTELVTSMKQDVGRGTWGRGAPMDWEKWGKWLENGWKMDEKLAEAAEATKDAAFGSFEMLRKRLPEKYGLESTEMDL